MPIRREGPAGGESCKVIQLLQKYQEKRQLFDQSYEEILGQLISHCVDQPSPDSLLTKDLSASLQTLDLQIKERHYTDLNV